VRAQGFHSSLAGNGFSHLSDAFLGGSGAGPGGGGGSSSNRAFIGQTGVAGGAGGHRRGNSTDNLGGDPGLDEILSMPWLAEDHDAPLCSSSSGAAGGAGGPGGGGMGGGVTPLGNSLSGRLHLPGSDQWSPGGDVRW
jgi:hypothetical protein